MMPNQISQVYPKKSVNKSSNKTAVARCIQYCSNATVDFLSKLLVAALADFYYPLKH
jgi:hypothetical protein